jgi:hypothetical protein
MSYDDSDRNREPSGTSTDSDRVSVVRLVLAALAALVLIAMLSPRTREVRDESIGVVRESIAPGPIPTTAPVATTSRAAHAVITHLPVPPINPLAATPAMQTAEKNVTFASMIFRDPCRGLAR